MKKLIGSKILNNYRGDLNISSRNCTVTVEDASLNIITSGKRVLPINTYTISVTPKENYYMETFEVNGNAYVSGSSIEVDFGSSIEISALAASISTPDTLQTTSASLFTFRENTLTSYIGDLEQISIPSSYSLGEDIIENHVVDTFEEAQSLVSLNSRLLPITLVDSSGITYKLNSTYDLTRNQSNIVFPITITLNIPQYIDGNDYEITTIENSAFANNALITKVVLPSSITRIGLNAFKGCIKLEDISLSSNIKNIESEAFLDTPWLTNLMIDEYGLCIVESRDDSNIKYLIKAVDESLPNDGIITSEMLEGVKAITGRSFDSCSNLIEISIPDSVEAILNSHTFLYCGNLKKISIGRNVPKIDTFCFSYCTSLEQVIMLSTTPPALGTWTFLNTNDNFKIYVPSSSVNAYKSASDWSDYVNKIYSINDLLNMME